MLSFIRWIPFFALIAIQFPASSAPALIDAGAFDTLHEAAAALPDEGGVLRIPPGRYEINQPIIINTTDTRIEGSGTASVIVNKNRNGAPALLIQSDGYKTNSRERIWRVQVADLRITGNPDSGHGIEANGVNELHIHDTAVEYNGGCGIVMVDCYEDPRIIGNLITYNKDAGLRIVRGHDIVVNANQFEENQDAVQCIDSFNLCMNGNNLDDHLGHGVVIENTYGSVLSGNMIEECQGAAVVMDRDCYGNTVSANVIAHNFSGGIKLLDAWGCAISANTFTINRPWSLTIGPDAGRITVSANSFSNAHIGGRYMRDDPAGGIRIQGDAPVLISGNTFSALSSQSIHAETENEHIWIDGNQFIKPFSEDARGEPYTNLLSDIELGESNSVLPR